MKYFAAILICFFSMHTHSQIVNVEARRLQSDTTGWLGSFGVSFKLDKNTVSVLNLNTNGQIEYKAPKSLYLFLVNYDLLRGAEATLQNNLFFHIRYNYKLTNTVRLEAFTQMQSNNLSGIKNRWLMGAGPRFKVSKTEKLALYAATLAMYEDERELTKPPIHHQDVRSSSYATATWRPGTNTEVVTTLFYQPLFKDPSDFRLLHELKLKFLFTKKFSFNTTWSYIYDSNPPAAVPNDIYSLKNGIEYNF